MSRYEPRLSLPQWRTGSTSITSPLGGSEHTDGWTIVVAGDWAGVREFETAATEPLSIYHGLAEMLSSADLAVVNLECPLGEGTPIDKDGPVFCSPPSAAGAIRAAGFHVASLANNHTYDQGSPGLEQTLGACGAAGLITVGAGSDAEAALAPAFVDAAGVRLGIIAAADREEGAAEWNRGGAAPIDDLHILDRVRDAAKQCDFLLVVAHSGKEYSPVPPPYWRRKLLSLASAGADAVVAHHPHVPQGAVLVERDSAPPVPVTFSTGNFVFPPRPASACMSAWMSLGYLVRLHGSSAAASLLELVPYRISPPTGVVALEGGDVELFRAFIETLSEPLVDSAAVEAWFDACVDHFWRHEWHARLANLTPAMCRGERDGLRHSRSHFRSPPHITLIDRAIERQLSGKMGSAPDELVQKLECWFAGTWPVRFNWLPRA